jgi:hypothetical protein
LPRLIRISLPAATLGRTPVGAGNEMIGVMEARLEGRGHQGRNPGG